MTNPWNPQPQGFPQQGYPQQGQPQQQHQPVEQTFDLDSVFDQAGGGGLGAPSYKWPEQADPTDPTGRRFLPIIGGSIQGEVVDVFMTVVKDATTQEPKLIKKGARAGQQMPQVNVTLQTDLRDWQGVNKIPLVDNEKPEFGVKPPSEDTGLRRIYLKFKMLEAVAAAIRTSPQGRGAPKEGAKLAVRLTKLEQIGAPNPLPHYEARYVPPVPTTPADTAWDTGTAPVQEPAVQQAPYVPNAGPVQQAAPVQQPQVPVQQPPYQPPAQSQESAWAAANAAPAGFGGFSDEPPF